MPKAVASTTPMASARTLRFIISLSETPQQQGAVRAPLVLFYITGDVTGRQLERC